VVHAAAERVPPVLSNRGFRLLWLAQIIGQTAQNAVLYALIVVVLELTKSTTSTSVVVLSFVVPTVAFGIFSGILVDRWSKRRLLIITNAGRAVCAIAFFFGRDHVLALYGVTSVFSSMSQLFTTSTAAAVPFMVSRQQLISANTLFSGAFTIAQIAGLIVLSPLILKTAGDGPLFASAAAAFLIATVLARLLPYIGGDGEEEAHTTFPGREEFRGAVSEFVKALSSLRSDAQSTLAMAHITVSSTLILLFAVMVPRFMQAILKVEPDNAVAIFAPVAFGALFGLRAVPLIVARMGKTKTVVLGLLGLAVFLGALGLVETIADLLERTDRFNPFGPARVFGLSILVALTMLFAGPLGFAYAMLNTPAQTTLHERTPVEMRGRVIASQMVLANGVALVPLVVVGGIADLYGVSSVVLAIAVLLALGGALSLYLERRWIEREGGSTPPHSGDQPEWSRRHETVPSSIDTT
jgi:DHA3 family macrolide efflux protein-like MFS transporter